MRAALNLLPRVYLAGPDVFSSSPEYRPETEGVPCRTRHGRSLPFDSQDEEKSLSKNAFAIFKRTVNSSIPVRQCWPTSLPSAGLLRRWNGLGDGLCSGQGKPVAAYSDDLSAYQAKVFQGGWSVAPGDARDRNGNEIENFGGIDTLQFMRHSKRQLLH